jgi:minor extracellular serine protease Vpr
MKQTHLSGYLVGFFALASIGRLFAMDKIAADSHLSELRAMGLNGKGVIIGFNEDGVDIGLPDFRHPDGRSRFLYLNGVDSSELNRRIKDLPMDKYFPFDPSFDSSYASHLYSRIDLMQHGNIVVGVAAGNGKSVGIDGETGRFVGIAPEADLVLCSSLSVLDSVARRYQMPYVANFSSVGSNPSGVDSIMEENRPGRCYVGAAGNSNRKNAFVRDFSEGDTSAIDFWYDSLFKCKGCDSVAEGDGWQLFKLREIGFRIAVMEDSTFLDSSLTITLKTHFKKVITFTTSDCRHCDTRANAFCNLFLNTGIPTYAQLSYAKDYNEVSYSMNFSFHTPSPPGDPIPSWGFKIRRSSTNYKCKIIFIFTKNQEEPDIPECSFPYQTIDGIGNCVHIITVGAYNNRGAAGNPPWIEGDIAPYSGNGPGWNLTQFNIIKPDICAPGSRVIVLMRNGGMDDSIHGMTSGTSISCPVVAGAVALMLQAKPTLTQEQVKSILHETALTDSFTGFTPNNIWGWGKLNLRKAISRVTKIGNSEIHNDNSGGLRLLRHASTRHTLRFTCDFPRPGMLCVRMVNARGSVVVSKSIATTAGVNYNGLDVRALSGGVYLLVLETDECRKVVKVMIN